MPLLEDRRRSARGLDRVPSFINGPVDTHILSARGTHKLPHAKGADVGLGVNVVGGFHDGKIGQFNWQAAVPEDLLHLCDVSPGALQTGSGALFDSSLSSDPFEIDPLGGGDSFALTVYVFRGAAFLADVQDIVDPAHIEWIKKDQLRNGILSEDFFPKLNGTLQAWQ